jgi:hypothetical protein
MRVFGQCDLGDGRRTARLVALGAELAKDGGGTVASACGDDAGAAEGGYRLLRNKHVSVEAIAEGGFASAAEMASEVELLLAIQDTTTLSYSHSVAEQLGDLGGPEKAEGRGWFVHNTLLLDGRTGKTVGLIDQERWRRAPKSRGKRHERKETPYEDKESFKWQAASERVGQRLGAETMSRVVEVCDREADVYEYLAYKLDLNERFVVRSRHDRSVDSEAGRLWQTVSEQKPLGDYEVKISQRGGQKGSKTQKPRKARKGRTAKVTVRSARVTLKPPYRPDRKLHEQEIWIIQVLEERSPKGEDGLEWLLLTTEAADSFETARAVIGHYERRWRIEDYHKAWKSGCRVEDQRLQAPDNLERMAVILAFVAVRLFQLKEMSEDKSELPCTAMLSDIAWKCLWLSVLKKSQPKKLPDDVPSLTWAYYGIARLGGFQDTKRTGRVGWAALWKGWVKLADRAEGFELALQTMWGQM